MPSIWLGPGEKRAMSAYFHGGYILAQAGDKEQDKHDNDQKIKTCPEKAVLRGYILT